MCFMHCVSLSQSLEGEGKSDCQGQPIKAAHSQGSRVIGSEDNSTLHKAHCQKEGDSESN